MLGCHGGTIYRAVHQGELDCIRVGDRYRFSERGVLAYLNRR